MINKIRRVIKIEKKIEIVTEKLPNGKNAKKRIETLEKRINKTLTRALLFELRTYERRNINEQAYNLIKENLEWLINN